MEESKSEGGEFERERVPESHLLGPGKFWGMYAGEHCAGTEFMIGPLFLGAGASLGDLVLGLLLGNVLAVLTWRYLVVPIAIAKRYTLYYQLERIAGSRLVKLYNVVNGVLFCFLAGAMITVSASAVGVPFGIDYEVPESIFGLGPLSFTALVVLVGLVISVVASSGYATVARVANLAAPWMIIVFGAAGLVSLGQMEVNSLGDLTKGEYWSQAVDFVATEYQEKGDTPPVFGFWQIVLFAWLCNGAMHFGMADLSIFRFARDKSSGWAPSIGMFLGHYMAWIAAGLMLAAQIKLSSDTTANPGVLAHTALGWTGILCVVIAGWTTANPTIYRAGLALQGVFTKSSRVRMTLLAGLIATVAGAFPNLSGRLLGFVGTYGTVLGPMGAVIFVDYYWFRTRQADEPAVRSGSTFNLAVLVAWLLPVTAGLYCIFFVFKQGTDAAYCVIPCWIVCGAIYWALRSAFIGTSDTPAIPEPPQ
ncbi:cytosine permease [Planctomycetes bacterium MalM25]|nr:cytosine permease [Planctomycetes bacterium MalM25]